jgi:HK97 family phage prohead protease
MSTPTAQPAIEHKSFGAPLVSLPEDEPGTIKAIVAVFNSVDTGGDRIHPGFFAKSIARKLPKGVWGHDWLSPVAKTIEARELHPGDPELPPGLMELGGLYIKGQFNLNTQRGREAYEDVKFGSVDEFSFGYRLGVAETDKKTGVRELIEGDIFEWSPVLAGMHSRTALLSVKSREMIAPPSSGTAFVDHAKQVESAVEAICRRAVSRVDARIKANREVSASNRGILRSVADSLRTGFETLDALLERTDPANLMKSDAVPAPATVADPSGVAEIAATDAPPAVGAADDTPAESGDTSPADAAITPELGVSNSDAVLLELVRFEAIANEMTV